MYDSRQKPSWTPRKLHRLPKEAYSANNIFYITACTQHRRPLFAHVAGLAEACGEGLAALATERSSSLHAWVVMPDHVHFIIQDQDVINFVALFKGRLTRQAWNKGVEGKVWQRGFHDHALRAEEDIKVVARYIWHNPVRASLTDNPADHRWSGSQTWPQWRAWFGRG